MAYTPKEITLYGWNENIFDNILTDDQMKFENSNLPNAKNGEPEFTICESIHFYAARFTVEHFEIFWFIYLHF